MKKSILLLCFLLLTAQSFAAIQEDSMPIFAVIEGQETAIDATLTIHLINGTGNVFTSVEPLVGSSTQESQRTVVSYLTSLLPTAKNYDYLFEIRGDASDVDGPSAGAAMALLSYSMLQNKKLPDTVGMTGTVSKEGYIGKVGGIFYKAKKAAQLGIKLFLIPVGESKQTTVIDGKVQTVFLPDYAYQNWNMIVKEVKTVQEAYNLAFSNLDNIDISQQNQTPSFIPTTESQYINNDFKVLAEQYLKDANSNINQVYQKIEKSNSLSYNDLALISARIEVAEDFLKHAESAQSKKYYYSSASFALVSTIYSSYALEIAQNPNILDPDSFIFSTKAMALEVEYKKFEKTIKENFNSSCLHYSIGALQRYAWGKKLLESLETQETVIIDVGGQAIDGTVYSQIFDYVEAKERLKIANKLYDFSLSCENNFSEQPDLSMQLDSYALKIENLLEKIENKDSVLRKIETADILQKEGFDSAALLELGEAYSEAEIELLDLNLEETKSYALQNLSQTPESEWGKIYLTHSSYYYQEGEFYESISDLSSAKGAYESSILFSKYSQQYDEIYAILLNQDYQEKEQSLDTLDIPIQELVTVFAIFALLITIIFLLTIHPKLENPRNLDDDEISLRKKYSDGKISQAVYLAQSKVLEEKKQTLLNQKKQKTIKLSERFFLEEEISSLTHLIKRLESLDKRNPSPYLKKEIQKHKSKLNQYKTKLSSLTKK